MYWCTFQVHIIFWTLMFIRTYMYAFRNLGLGKGLSFRGGVWPLLFPIPQCHIHSLAQG